MKMSSTHYNLSSQDYRSTVFTGFSRLQKGEEFVDLTLAADGCFCKVHRSLIALASPYLRDILMNLHGNTPVIYLNKVRKEIFEHIIEYIYQGEVNIPIQILEEFIEVSKSLHIAGIANLEPPKVSSEPLRSASQKAKKRKLGERVHHVEESKPTDFKTLTQLDDSSNIDHNYGNDDYCTGEPIQTSNDSELHSLNTNHDHESNKQTIVKNYNKDLIIFHPRKENHHPSIHIENEQTLVIPTETKSDFIIDQTEATKNIPLIEIQSCPSQQDNHIIIDLHNELAMPANTTPDHNNVESSLPVYNILTNNKLKNFVTENNTQSSQFSQTLIETVTVPDQCGKWNSKPVFQYISNDITRHAETEYDRPSLFQVGQPLIEIAPIPDQNNGGKIKPVFEIIKNVIIKSAESDYVAQSSQVNQPLFEIDSFPDQNKREKSKPTIKILKNDVIKSAEADDYGTLVQISQPPIQTTINRVPNNVDNCVPVAIDSNNEIADGGESNLNKITLNDMKNMAQYSITERGALQLILNRFIYCCHGTSTKKQRWRCIDYRRGACPAIVDTGADGAIIHRKGLHAHEFHDKKICKKHKEGLIYSTMALAITARDLKERKGTGFVSIDEIDDADE